jgi:hypothetical protein
MRFLSFARRDKLTPSQCNFLIRMVDSELSNALDAMPGFTDLDRRRIMRDWIEELESIRARLVSLK